MFILCATVRATWYKIKVFTREAPRLANNKGLAW